MSGDSHHDAAVATLASHATPYLIEWADASIVRRQRALVESVGGLVAVTRSLAPHAHPQRLQPTQRRDPRCRRLSAVVRLRLGARDPRAPQCDLAHFLCFVLDPGASGYEIALHVELPRAALAGAAGTSLDPGAWEAGFRAALADLLINRLMFYVMIHRVRPLRFPPRIVRTWQWLHDLFGAAGATHH